MIEPDYENFKDALEALDEFKSCIDRAGLNMDFVEIPRVTLSIIEHEDQMMRIPIWVFIKALETYIGEKAEEAR